MRRDRTRQTGKRILRLGEHRAVVRRAADRAERVLPLFEEIRPKDLRPRLAIDAGRAWARGAIRFPAIRRAALAAHAAARATLDPAARAAARAAGHAAATAHVATHALAVGAYARAALESRQTGKRAKLKVRSSTAR